MKGFKRYIELLQLNGASQQLLHPGLSAGTTLTTSLKYTQKLTALRL